jgi:predicted nucleic acid-binding protein
LIGAHARSLGIAQVTYNRREFDRMQGLSVGELKLTPPLWATKS